MFAFQMIPLKVAGRECGILDGRHACARRRRERLAIESIVLAESVGNGLPIVLNRKDSGRRNRRRPEAGLPCSESISTVSA